MRSRPAVGLHAVSLLLTLQRQVPVFLKNQEKHGWDRSAAAKAVVPLGQTCAVLGFGFIGREIARLMRALGSHVIGVSRTGAPDSGADEMQPIAKLDDVLKRSDSIMISLPLDSATHHLINARTLGLCKKNAIIVNIARGGIIDQIALTEALKNGNDRRRRASMSPIRSRCRRNIRCGTRRTSTSRRTSRAARGASRRNASRRRGGQPASAFKSGEALKNVVKL